MRREASQKIKNTIEKSKSPATKITVSADV
jgi:hypothetical protein